MDDNSSVGNRLVLGFVVGAMAGLAFVLVTHAAGSSDGSGAVAILIIPLLGAVTGWLLGFAIPLLRHAWKRGNRALVLLILTWVPLFVMILEFGTKSLTVLALFAIGVALSVAIKKFTGRRKRANT